MRVFESSYPIKWWSGVVLLATIIVSSSACANGFRASDLRLMLEGEISSSEEQELPGYEKPLLAVLESRIEFVSPGTAGAFVERNDGQGYVNQLAPGGRGQRLADGAGVLVLAAPH